MHKVKIALFNAQKNLENDEVAVLSQKIAGVSFKNDETENTYSKQDRIKVTVPQENQRILWRDDLWDSLAEEYTVITSKKAFIVTIEEKLEKIGSKQEWNRFIEIESEDLENNDEHNWKILSPDDIKYAIVNESEIQKSSLQVILGGKK